MVSSNLVLPVLAALCNPVVAQTFTSCSPLEKTCPEDPALGKAVSYDFRKGSPLDFAFSTGAFPTFDSSGAEFAIAQKLDSPTMTSNWYIMFGHVEVVLKTAPGKGAVSSVVLQSDDLDEVDWEWLGAQENIVQTNYFGKGNTTTYDREVDVSVTTPEQAFHTYSVDWTADALTWSIDGMVLRTVTPQNAKTNQYPQTPMRLKIGTWPGGDPTLNPGVVAWAGGPIDYSKGPYTMTVQSVKVIDYSTGTSYSYGDKSGNWQSIKSNGGKINRAGDPNAPAVAMPMGASTSSIPAPSLSSGSSSTSSRATASNDSSTSARSSTASSVIKSPGSSMLASQASTAGSNSITQPATSAGVLPASSLVNPGSATGLGSSASLVLQIKTGQPIGGFGAGPAPSTNVAAQATPGQPPNGPGNGGSGFGSILSSSTGLSMVSCSSVVTSKLFASGSTTTPTSAAVVSSATPLSVGSSDSTSKSVLGISSGGSPYTSSMVNSRSNSSSSASSNPNSNPGPGPGPQPSSTPSSTQGQPAGGFATLTRTVTSATTSSVPTPSAGPSSNPGSGSGSTAAKNSAPSDIIPLPAAIQSAIDAIAKKNPGLAQCLMGIWKWFLQIISWATGQR